MLALVRRLGINIALYKIPVHGEIGDTDEGEE